MDPSWDRLIRGAPVFDGSGRRPEIEDVAMSGGRIAALGRALTYAGCGTVPEAADRELRN